MFQTLITFTLVFVASAWLLWHFVLSSYWDKSAKKTGACSACSLGCDGCKTVLPPLRAHRALIKAKTLD